jgi:hypothetical protein
VVSEETRGRTYRALQEEVPDDAPREGGFAILRVNPAPSVAQRLHIMPNSARNYLGKLDKDLYNTETDEQGRFWRVRMPEDDGDVQERLSLDTEDVAGVEELNTLFRRVAERVRELEADNLKLREDATEVEALRRENAKLRAQIDQVIQTLGRIDINILRDLIQNEQKTRGD